MNKGNHVSILKFNEVKKNLPEFVQHEWRGKNLFKGFYSGVVLETEKYKYDLRFACIEILDVEKWEPDWIGKGEIANRVLSCLRHKDNNLLGDKQGVGEKAKSYYKLALALELNERVEEVEQVLFDLFVLKKDNELTFNRFIDFFGKKYSVLAFLFFLSNDKKYLPISTSNFEHAFRVLGIKYKLQKNCSWDNYIGYINIIKEVKFIIEAEYEENINLLDAHSFGWLIGYRDRYQKWLDGLGTTEEASGSIYLVKEIKPKAKPKTEKKSINIPDLNQEDSNIDWDARNRKNRLKGSAAEGHVINYEVERLNSLGKHELAKKVDDYSKKLGQGFDVLSFNEDGSHRKIEVKATDNDKFFISANELEKSQQENYWIYLVKVLNDKVEIRTIKSPELHNEENFTLVPQNYEVRFTI